MMTTNQRAELDAAMAKATEGPWGADGWRDNRIVWSGPENRVCFMAIYPKAHADSLAIVALHNAYPLLTATIDAQAAEIADCEANINLKADFIEATINQLAQADETIARLREALGDMMELFSADDYYMAYRAGSQHQSVRLAAARAALASTGAA
jgi:hypothetical protein